ncbi:unnamed protein product [Chondrus crispus]|uniref:AB hydrolase-1 domain-containing protein n=1 Tax=Chondrus crispus TaxID=2769 RepID=R7QAX6_CHOCR|nr:unnamed protein product [Chondrus crispus]CDF34615.1 unnamed protein product [Chondrus crispus]|eukprot:XP_005714434.1 unnamed protein product [Chondrus crispus]
MPHFASRRPPEPAFLAPALTPLLVASIAATIEAATRLKERTRRPPGQLVAVRNDGRRVHVVYDAPPALESAPCVVMEAGANSWSPVWDGVASDLASITRVLRYDRAGFGFSDSDPSPMRDVRSVADDLASLIASVGARPPYLLVAHSLGALYANVLLQLLNPADVCGIVYVDAASPETVALLEKIVPTSSPPAWLAKALGWFGLLRLFAPVALKPYASAFHGDLRDAAMATWAKGDWLMAYTREWRAAMMDVKVSSGEAMKFPPGWLGSLPIAVLVPDVYRRTKGMAYIGDLQTRLATYSSDAIVIPVQDCGHFIHLERPDVVAGAVQNVIQRAQGRAHVQEQLYFDGSEPLLISNNWQAH